MELDGVGGIQNDSQDFGFSNWVDGEANNKKNTMEWEELQEWKDGKFSLDMLSLRSGIHVTVFFMVVQFRKQVSCT